MQDELLQLARLAVVGLPRLEFAVMGQEQFGQVMRILAVVLGAAGDEGFAELLQRDGIDGVESDPGIGFQEDDQADGRLFQAEGHATLGMLLTQ